MTRSIYCVLFTTLFFLCGTHLHAQTGNDIIDLKDGQHVKGTIIELAGDRTVKIRTADSSIYIYQMTDVKKVSLNPPSSIHGAEPFDKTSDLNALGQYDARGNLFMIYAGISVPTGLFAAQSTEEGDEGAPGAALTGFMLGADADVKFSAVSAGMVSLNYAVNGRAAARGLAEAGYNAESGPWKTFWTMLGLKVFTNISPDMELFGFGQAGLLFGNLPKVNIHGYGLNIQESSSSANTTAFGLGIGLISSNFVLNLRYLTARPEYQPSIASDEARFSTTVIQHTNCIFMTAGFAL